MPDPTLMPNPDAGIFRSSDTWVLSGAGFLPMPGGAGAGVGVGAGVGAGVVLIAGCVDGGWVLMVGLV